MTVLSHEEIQGKARKKQGKSKEKANKEKKIFDIFVSRK
ncbi:hypothetical protein UNSWDHB_1966 [Dehalobacter sp. UNSWDHB]|nr:hypothetical protein UNSWDHB_1966 [Dehalobacter sp. UNSWDHB]